MFLIDLLLHKDGALGNKKAFHISACLSPRWGECYIVLMPVELFMCLGV